MTVRSLTLLSGALFLMGARGGGCGGAAASRSPAPAMAGTWAVEYEDTIDVEVRIGGAVYTAQTGAAGGSVEIEHEGRPVTFDLDCDRPEVLCPAEAWPAEVQAEQRNGELAHQVIVSAPEQVCGGELVEPAPEECGEGTLNPDCESVCDGEVTTATSERFGVVSEQGDHFTLLLGGGLATNGVNCALLGLSVAEAELETSGSAEGGDWEAVSMQGDVIVGYAGGCLWAGDPDDDGQLEALVLGASIKLSVGFTATRSAE